MLVATCPSREELLDFAVGKLSDEAAESLAGHLDSCENCQAELAALSDAEDTLVARLRGPLPPDPFLDEPECSRAVAIARAVGDCPDFCLSKNGTVPIDAPSATNLPRLLGEYQLLERLGSGGMGTVYKALHTKLGRVVALKVLTRARTHDPAAVARFEREMHAVGQLDHRHIVRAHDAREIEGTPILVMEYLDGLDLGEIVRRVSAGVPASAGSGQLPAKAGTPAPARGIPIPDAAELARQTAVGLQTIHEHGLVHRDIKPSNLMLTADGEVKILDLGLARLRPDVPPGEEMTATGQGMGTADYMAPEQASDSRAVDIRADIYSLGCTLYKLLTGRAPFSGPDYCTAFDKMTAHVHAAPPPIRGLAPAVPEGLATVLDRMLAKNPTDRFATPARVAEALAPYCAGADLATLLKRAASSPPHPPGDAGSRSRWPSGTNSGRRENKNLPSPSGRGAGGEGRRWKRFVGQLVLLMLAGGLGFALAIILRIHKDGKDTTIELPDGSNARVSANGQVDVDLPGSPNAGQSKSGQPIAAVEAAIAPRKVAVIRPSTRTIPDYLETTGKIIGESAAKDDEPKKLVKFDIDQRTFARMVQAAQKRNARRAGPDPFGNGRAKPNSSGINWPAILQINYGFEALDEKGFPHRAEIKTLADRIDTDVPAIPCTAYTDLGDRFAALGMSVRVRMNTGTTHDILVLSQQVLTAEPSGKQILYVVNAHNVVEPRAVEVGKRVSIEPACSEITGVNRDEVVIADSSTVRPGMVVKPDFIAGALQSPTPAIEFVETPLRDIVAYLRESLRINIEIDERGLAAAKIDRDVQCTLNIRDISLASALRLLLSQVGLTYVVEDEYILITAPGRESSLDMPKPSGAEAQSAKVVSDRRHAAAPLPTVRVTQPVVCNVCDYEEYTGRIERENNILIRVPEKGMPVFRFKRSTTVKKGDLLAEIVTKDDWPKLMEKGEALNQLALSLAGRGGRGGRAGATPPSNADAEEQWKSALADWNLASGNTKTVKIFAPCSGNADPAFGPFLRGGRGGRGGENPRELEAGTILGRITTSDSMVVTFDIDERAVLAHRRMPNRKPNWELSLPVVFGLADDKGFPYRGEVTSVAADIDPQTHAQHWQAVVPNRDGIFMPGMTVRVRLITSEPHKVMLISDRVEFYTPSSGVAGQKEFSDSTVVGKQDDICVLDEGNTLRLRKVTLGRIYDYHFASVVNGLSAADWIVVENGSFGVPPPGRKVNPERLTTSAPPWASISVPPSVTVAHPVAREVTNYEEFTGHLEAVQTAEIRARASGNLDKVCFKPGMSVKKGDILFEIDPRLYQAELDQAAGAVKQAQIRLNQKTREVARFQELMKHAAISQAEYDRVLGQRDEAAAAVQTAEAALNVARVRLDYTKVTAPFAGRIGRSLLDAGNLVTADKTVLATLNSTDPMYVYFDIDERTMLAIQRKEGSDHLPPLSLPVSFALSDEQGFPHSGKMDAADSRIDPATGTARSRAVLPNKDGMLSPGMFVRVRLAISAPHRALLVPDRATGSDQGRKFVFVVTDLNVAERRDVEVGALQEDEMRAISKGLTADDWVIISGLPQLKPGTTVTPEKAETAAK